ncbi:MAG: hypothetical protein K8S13_03935 [Desulfobacula sp.]|uniref:hypothetical protein n=1 Tax=Desulfobacula sp. TaxID=2593537 RepID=UPI0025C0A70A|nr:hypothetical protein [Desulfobacula sp.]MCD4718995.1 hypothetical protein [Desulfobacula sp.]
MNKISFSKIFASILIIFIAFLSFPLANFANNKQTIAILPFEMISPEDITYIQSGILQMLHSRLVWKDHVIVVEKKIIAAHLNAIDIQDNDQLFKKIASLTNSDYVLAGSITQFSNAFSIDTKIYDIKNQQYLNFFEQSKIIDDVIPKLNVIAAKINKKVFERKTVVYQKLAKEEKEKAEQWKRQNPEKMMPLIPRGEQEEKTSIWKFWEYL